MNTLPSSSRRRLALALPLAFVLGACAGLRTRDPVRFNVVGIEPMLGAGMEARFNLKVRLQNPNEQAIDYDGIAVELDLDKRTFASGVSSAKGSVPRYGETLLEIPVSVSALTAVRQAIAMMEGRNLDAVPYELRAKLGGSLFSGQRFTERGTLKLPALRLPTLDAE